MTPQETKGISDHSIRVGVTQDVLALNIDLGSVMQAGTRKTTAMPMRYGEEVQAGLGGMARTAKAKGRADTFTLLHIWRMMQLRKKAIERN